MDGLLSSLLRLPLLAVTLPSCCAPPDSSLAHKSALPSVAVVRRQATQHAEANLLPLAPRCRRPLHPGRGDSPAVEHELLRPAVRGVLAGVLAVAVSLAGGRLRRRRRAKLHLLAGLSCSFTTALALGRGRTHACMVDRARDPGGGLIHLALLANSACSRTGGTAAVVEEAHESLACRLESRCYPVLHDRRRLCQCIPDYPAEHRNMCWACCVVDTANDLAPVT